MIESTLNWRVDLFGFSEVPWTPCPQRDRNWSINIPFVLMIKDIIYLANMLFAIPKGFPASFGLFPCLCKYPLLFLSKTPDMVSPLLSTFEDTQLNSAFDELTDQKRKYDYKYTSLPFFQEECSTCVILEGYRQRLRGVQRTSSEGLREGIRHCGATVLCLNKRMEFGHSEMGHSWWREQSEQRHWVRKS